MYVTKCNPYCHSGANKYCPPYLIYFANKETEVQRG